MENPDDEIFSTSKAVRHVGEELSDTAEAANTGRIKPSTLKLVVSAIDTNDLR